MSKIVLNQNEIYCGNLLLVNADFPLKNNISINLKIPYIKFRAIIPTGLL